MYAKPLTTMEISELQVDPAKFAANHPERVVIDMKPTPSEGNSKDKVYKMRGIAVITR